MKQQQQINYKLIRGKRLLTQLQEQSSYNDLYADIQRGFPKTRARQYATQTIAVQNLKYVPVTRGLNVQATVRSNQREYDPQIQFLGVKFIPPSATSTTFMGSDGQERSVEPIDLTKSNVKVRCNCLDFYFRFATWNYNDSSLWGRKPPLYRKVPGSNRPPVNPMRVPGVCKHIIRLVEHLQQIGIVR